MNEIDYLKDSKINNDGLIIDENNILQQSYELSEKKTHDTINNVKDDVTDDIIDKKIIVTTSNREKKSLNNHRIKKYLGVDIKHDTFLKEKPNLRQYLLLKKHVPVH